MKALRIEHLSINFGGVQALQDVSFSVESGERLAIIGPNGAGKTTLFNVVNGQLSATTGRIYFFERDITTMPTYSRAHLGQARSFQATTLFPKLTALNNVRLAVQGTKPSRYQVFRPINAYEHLSVKAQELLEAENLWEKRDDQVRNLSHGEQRRLEIALSLASEPKLLLLDEPSAGLTSAESTEVISMIRNLGPDITVLTVAHDMDLVFGVAERIIVLHYGQIIIDGTPEEVRDNPRVKEIYMGTEEDTGIARAS